MAEIMFETFKGNKMICIPVGTHHDEEQYLRMGYKKAKAVVDHIDDIENLVIHQVAEIMFETFKGNKMICIPVGTHHDEEQYLRMGYKKAKAVVEHIDDIENWVIHQEVSKGGK